MTRYPNSTCELHSDVRTSEPICLVCLSNRVRELEKVLLETHDNLVTRQPHTRRKLEEALQRFLGSDVSDDHPLEYR